MRSARSAWGSRFWQSMNWRTTMMDRSTICIVGAGLFGLSAAVALAQAGHRVRIVEAGPIPNPANSSWDTQRAVRSEYGENAFYTAHCVRAIERWRELEARDGLGIYTQAGITLLADDDPASQAFLSACLDNAKAMGLPARIADADEYPLRFRSRTAQAYFNPNGGWVNPSRYSLYLVTKAQSLGVEFVPHTAAGIDARNRTGVMVGPGLDDRFDVILLCCGAFQIDGAPVPTKKVRQRKLYFRPFDGDAAPVLSSVWVYNIAREAAYGFPESDGVWSLGFHTDTELNEVDLAGKLAILSDLFGKALSARWFQQKHCNYSQTDSTDFIIDRHPDFDNVFVATGGSGHAFKFAPLLGEWITARMTGERIDALDRFQWPNGSGA